MVSLGLHLTLVITITCITMFSLGLSETDWEVLKLAYVNRKWFFCILAKLGAGMLTSTFQ